MATQELDFTQLDELIARIKDAQAHQLSLSPADLQLVLDCILTLATMQSTLAEKNTTVYKLRKLLGMLPSDERLSRLLNQLEQKPQDAEAEAETPDEPSAQAAPKIPKKPRNPPKKKPVARIMR